MSKAFSTHYYKSILSLLIIYYNKLNEFTYKNGRRLAYDIRTWFVGNGFIIVPGFGNPDTDSQAKSRIESYFTKRDVHLIEMLSSWAAGGGVHCHTNDQPACPKSK